MPALSQLSVILPVLNERDNLAELIPELCEALKEIIDDLEIIVVDDSSTDKTDELITDLSRNDKGIRYISRVGKPKSLPASITEGIEAASFANVAWMDADGSMSPTSLRDLVCIFQQSSNKEPIVVGSRFVTGGGFKGIEVVGETSIRQVVKNLRGSQDSLSAVVLSRLLNRYLWLILNRCCRDLASGFVVASKSSVLHIGLKGSYGDYCVRFIYLAHRSGLKIIEAPYTCLVRRHGYSKTGTTIWELVRRGIPYVLLPFKIRRTKTT